MGKRLSIEKARFESTIGLRVPMFLISELLTFLNKHALLKSSNISGFFLL